MTDDFLPFAVVEEVRRGGGGGPWVPVVRVRHFLPSFLPDRKRSLTCPMSSEGRDVFN